MTICQRIIVLLPLWVFAGVAFAEGIETKVTGSARLRYEDSFAKDPISPERTAFSSIRIRPSFQVTVNPELNLVVEPQFAKIFGV
jgi:hypothetical protein